MSWIESHQNLATHPKLFKLATLTGYDSDKCIAKLHRLWWWALDYAEDGDLSRFQPEAVGFGMQISDSDEAKMVFQALVESGFIDARTLYIHDWLEYAGKYLKSKYHTSNPMKYEKILRKHTGRPKGRPEGVPKGKAQKGSAVPEGSPPTYQPNQPNLPDLPKDSQTSFEVFWRVYPKKKSKGQAERAWKKINPDEQLLAKILSSIERAKTSQDWLREKGRYIPYPATWLQGRGWEDEFDGGENGGGKGKYAGIGVTIEADGRDSV